MNETSTQRQQWHLKAETEQTALELLASQLPPSRGQLKTLMHNGAVWLENRHGIGRCRRAKKALMAGDQLHVYFDPAVQAEAPLAAALIADEGDFSVWNKPAGMLSQGSKWGDHCTLYRFAEQHLQPQRPAFIVHRLDRATRGLMLLAHRKKTATAISDLFANRQVQKHYKAKVAGLMDLPVPFDLSDPLDDKPAHTRIESLTPDTDNQQTLLRLQIQTGRKHQIRRHLADLGYPVIGDSLYGQAERTAELQLSSVLLRFELGGKVYSYHSDGDRL